MIEQVEPHPSSVNSPVGYYSHRWLVYNEKVKTSGIYLRCSTMVPDYALLLLGGDLKQVQEGPPFFISSARNGWLLDAESC